MMGFRPVARHRSREVLLYRQGDMNVVINAHAPAHAPAHANANGHASASTRPDRAPLDPAPSEAPTGAPTLAAIALRVRDASAAYQRALERGAWAVPTQVAVMELNIPAIHGVGSSRLYFVDRYREFSIWDVDFVPIPTVDPRPPALAGLHWFGLVQYIGAGRMEDWCAFYSALFGFAELPHGQRFGILPKGRILQSPCNSFYLQLIEPDPADLPGQPGPDGDERLQRLGLGTPDVAAAVAGAGRARGWTLSRPPACTATRVARSPPPGWAAWPSSWCTTRAAQGWRDDRRLRPGHHHPGRHAGVQAGGQSATPASVR